MDATRYYSYSTCQSMLPATGAPVSRHRTNKMKEMFDEYVRMRTQQNWKFWIVSFLCFFYTYYLKALTRYKVYKVLEDYFPQCNNQFSILLEPLLLSFNTSVSNASIDDLYKSTLLWVEQHCSLVDLRPGSYTNKTFINVHLIFSLVLIIQSVYTSKNQL